MDSDFETIFANKQLRLTTPRRRVFAAMRRAGEPMTASSIAKQCPTMDRTSIYRTLELFTQLGIAHSVPIGWKQRYELASPFRSHHHHLTCLSCGKLVDIHSPQLERAMTKIAHGNGFAATEHTFEIRGLCETCQTTRAGGVSR